MVHGEGHKRPYPSHVHSKQTKWFGVSFSIFPLKFCPVVDVTAKDPINVLPMIYLYHIIHTTKPLLLYNTALYLYGVGYLLYNQCVLEQNINKSSFFSSKSVCRTQSQSKKKRFHARTSITTKGRVVVV